MRNNKIDKIDRIDICTKCGTQFRAETSAKCPSCCHGIVKSYNKSGAVIINALERAGYAVLDYSIPNDTDLNREIKIKFADIYEFAPVEPPEGFNYGSAKEPKDLNSNERYVTLLYKRYRADMSNWEYALELARDKVRLTEWIFSRLLVMSYIQY
jgi:hypothetical protein